MIRLALYHFPYSHTKGVLIYMVSVCRNGKQRAE